MVMPKPGRPAVPNDAGIVSIVEAFESRSGNVHANYATVTVGDGLSRHDFILGLAKGPVQHDDEPGTNRRILQQARVPCPEWRRQ